MTRSACSSTAEVQCRRTDVPHGEPTRGSASNNTAFPAGSQRSRAAFHLLEGVSAVMTQYGSNREAMFRGVVDLLPATSRFPEICCARIRLTDTVFATSNWRDTPWKISGAICHNGQPVGSVELAYLEPRPAADEGPFTRRECTAVGFVSALLAKTVERFHAIEQLNDTVRQLELERESLRQANTTLHGILSRIEEERNTVRRTITANVDKVLMPMLRELETRAEPRMRGMLELLRKSLEEIASPFVDRLARTFTSLTPLEIGICRMIRDNLTTKEIARIRHVSPATVARQREHIRAKLGIARSDANLATYLRTFLVEKENSG